MLEEWIEDALSSEATPQEIYDTIVNTIQRSANYHRACLNHSAKLLSLLEDNVVVNDTADNVVDFNKSYKVTNAKNQSEWKDFFKPSMDEFSSAEEGVEWVKKNGGYEYTPITDSSTWPVYTELPDLTKDVTINTTDKDTTHTVKLSDLTEDITINTTEKPDGAA